MSSFLRQYGAARASLTCTNVFLPCKQWHEIGEGYRLQTHSLFSGGRATNEIWNVLGYMAKVCVSHKHGARRRELDSLGDTQRSEQPATSSLLSECGGFSETHIGRILPWSWALSFWFSQTFNINHLCLRCLLFTYQSHQILTWSYTRNVLKEPCEMHSPSPSFLPLSLFNPHCSARDY